MYIKKGLIMGMVEDAYFKYHELDRFDEEGEELYTSEYAQGYFRAIQETLLRMGYDIDELMKSYEKSLQ